MRFYEDLYVTDNIADKASRILWKIKHNAGQINIYVIALAANEQNLLDIIPAQELLQKYYPKRQMYVVGLAKGREAAEELACQMVLEVYAKTKSFDVRSYFLEKRDKRKVRT